MKVLAISGSHRKGKTVATMLKMVLDEAQKQGAETELLELVDYNVKPCDSCNKCLRGPECSIKDDDMSMIRDKLLEVDAIILGSPVYFANVSGRMKDFIDRSRPLCMVEDMLAGKVGAALTHAGLRNGGQELAMQIMNTFLLRHGLFLPPGRWGKEVLISSAPMGTMFNNFDGGKVEWKASIEEDPITVEGCRRLGLNIVRTIKQTQ